MSVCFHAQEYLNVLTTAIFIIVTVEGEHLLSILIISIENCNSATPEPLNRPVVIGLWWDLDESKYFLPSFICKSQQHC